MKKHKGTNEQIREPASYDPSLGEKGRQKNTQGGKKFGPIGKKERFKTKFFTKKENKKIHRGGEKIRPLMKKRWGKK